MKSKIMSAIENACNGGVLDNEAEKCVNDFLSHAHRTLQSTFFKFVMKYIQINAIHYKENPARWFDGRNEWVGEMCDKICSDTPEMKIYDWQKERYEKTFPETAKDVEVEIKEDSLKG